VEKGFIAVKRFNTSSLSFQPSTACEYGFQLTHSGGTMNLIVAAEDYNMWIDELTKVITERNQKVVFGVALSELMARSPGKIVPSVFSDAAEYIRENGKDAEGIFRLSVTSNVLLEVQEMIDSGKTVLYTDVYVAANIIKSWLRALPEPLLTFTMFDQWIAAQDDTAMLYNLVQKLPKDNQFLLSALMHLMKDLTVYSEATRMTSNNLAIVIAPNILYRRGDEMNISQGPTNVVDTLITNYEDIFRDIIKKEADNAKFVSEVARSCHNTLRKRASKLLNNVNATGVPNASLVVDVKKSHHQTSTQASLMSIFTRDNTQPNASPAITPTAVPDTDPSIASPSSLSSTVVSETVNELLKYTAQSPATSPTDVGSLDPKSLPTFSGMSLDDSPGKFNVDPSLLEGLQVPTDNTPPPPPEFDVSGINFPPSETTGGSTPPPPEFDVSGINFPPSGTIGSSTPPPPELDVSGLKFPAGSASGLSLGSDFSSPPGTPMANPDILPPPLAADDIPPPDIPPPPLP